MKKWGRRIGIGFLVVEHIFLFLVFLLVCVCIADSGSTELLREDSPDGEYTLMIWELGSPDWPFGSDHLRVMFCRKGDPGPFRTSFRADVANDGAPARYRVEWTDMGVQVTLSGKEQPDAVYVLPYPQSDSGPMGR